MIEESQSHTTESMHVDLSYHIFQYCYKIHQYCTIRYCTVQWGTWFMWKIDGTVRYRTLQRKSLCCMRRDCVTQVPVPVEVSYCTVQYCTIVQNSTAHDTTTEVPSLGRTSYNLCALVQDRLVIYHPMSTHSGSLQQLGYLGTRLFSNWFGYNTMKTEDWRWYCFDDVVFEYFLSIISCTFFFFSQDTLLPTTVEL